MTTLTFAQQTVSSWGRLRSARRPVARLRSASQLQALDPDALRLPTGMGRSYGDVATSDLASTIDMTGLDRFRSFDPTTGVLHADAGVSLDEILRVFAPRGFFLPVTPGTRYATLGGAVANDVHGKNHMRAGTIGRHVRGLTLFRSRDGLIGIGPEREPELFRATVGGLGLTGIITGVEIALQPIGSTNLLVESRACDHLDALVGGLESSADFEHVAAWVDCTASGRAVGRGVLTCASWANDGRHEAHRPSRYVWPKGLPDGLLNPLTLAAFNGGMFARAALSGVRKTTANYGAVLHPLDSIGHWNRLYGRRGFHQHQAVIPKAAGREPIRALLAEIAASHQGSFLAVLKSFGALPSPGLLSFPREGLTLALDFRHQGDPTLALLSRLDAIVGEAGGRLYPAKDARMSARMFHSGYPEFSRFQAALDPACVSDFGRRVGLC